MEICRLITSWKNVQPVVMGEIRIWKFKRFIVNSFYLAFLRKIQTQETKLLAFQKNSTSQLKNCSLRPRWKIWTL